MSDDREPGPRFPEADRDLFLALFDSAPDAMFIVDEQGTILMANAVAHAMFQWPAGTLAGQAIEVLVPAAVAADHVAHRKAFAAAPKVRMMGARVDLKAVRVDGSDFYVEVSLSPIRWHGRQLVIAAVRDVTERRTAEQTAIQVLREQAIRDPLTGLFNRRMLDNILKLELARADRTRDPVAAIMVDVDHFKRINDQYGHDNGDRVLMKIASLIKRQMRAGDLACRYGGEEFALILPDCSLDTAVGRADSIRRLLRSEDYGINEGLPWPVTASFGVAVYPAHAGSPDGLLKAADRALLEAKNAGRDRVMAAAVPA